MRPSALLLALLSGLAFAAAPAAAALGPGACVPATIDADQPPRHLCAEPADLSCPVYTRTWDGVAWGPKSCLLQEAAPARCVLVGQDLDYAHYACVDARDADCPVYSLRSSGGHEVKTCVA